MHSKSCLTEGCPQTNLKAGASAGQAQTCSNFRLSKQAVSPINTDLADLDSRSVANHGHSALLQCDFTLSMSRPTLHREVRELCHCGTSALPHIRVRDDLASVVSRMRFMTPLSTGGRSIHP